MRDWQSVGGHLARHTFVLLDRHTHVVLFSRNTLMVLEEHLTLTRWILLWWTVTNETLWLSDRICGSMLHLTTSIKKRIGLKVQSVGFQWICWLQMNIILIITCSLVYDVRTRLVYLHVEQILLPGVWHASSPEQTNHRGSLAEGGVFSWSQFAASPLDCDEIPKKLTLEFPSALESLSLTVVGWWC